MSKSGSRIPPRPTYQHKMQQVIRIRLRRNVTDIQRQNIG